MQFFPCYPTRPTVEDTTVDTATGGVEGCSVLLVWSHDMILSGLSHGSRKVLEAGGLL